MPNKNAKIKKQQKARLNKKWKTEGRTAKQHKRWLEKKSDSSTLKYGKL
jgi:hypothetical protein|tara:strand:+ start:23 stop:169 length:147 start_codon:yes stop_codon:yes gene_type:complete